MFKCNNLIFRHFFLLLFLVIFGPFLIPLHRLSASCIFILSCLRFKTIKAVRFPTCRLELFALCVAKQCSHLVAPIPLSMFPLSYVDVRGFVAVFLLLVTLKIIGVFKCPTSKIQFQIYYIGVRKRELNNF